MGQTSGDISKASHKNLIKLTLVLMLLGTMAELLLIGHYEDQWQLLPISLTALATLCFFITLFNTSGILIKSLRFLMMLCMVSGGLGVWFHLQANIEFEKELYPTIGNWDLMKESLSGAIPALAPGSMIALGLVGYLFTLTNTKQ